MSTPTDWLDNLLTQRGRGALPYRGEAKWAVRQHLLDLVQVKAESGWRERSPCPVSLSTACLPLPSHPLSLSILPYFPPLTQEFPTLVLKVDEYTYPNGKSQQLLCAEGTLPMYYLVRASLLSLLFFRFSFSRRATQPATIKTFASFHTPTKLPSRPSFSPQIIPGRQVQHPHHAVGPRNLPALRPAAVRHAHSGHGCQAAPLLCRWRGPRVLSLRFRLVGRHWGGREQCAGDVQPGGPVPRRVYSVWQRAAPVCETAGLE